MNLLNGQIGSTYTVNNIDVADNIKHRLQALGLTNGTSINILNCKKSGTVIFAVRGTRLAVGREIAQGILVV